MNYFKLEIPYGTQMLLPIDGSEAFIKYLQRGTLVCRSWHDNDEAYIKETKYQIALALVNTTIKEPKAPEPEETTN